MTRTSSSATPAATSGPTTCRPLTGSPANSGRRLFARLRSDADLSATFGPDFKILASLEVAPGETRVEWRRLILSIQHIPKLPYERQHRILLPILEQILRDLEAGGLRGSGFDLRPGQAHPQRGRGIRHRRPRGGQRAFGKEARYRPLRAGRADRRRSACRQGSAQGGQVRRAAGPPIGQETRSRRSR